MVITKWDANANLMWTRRWTLRCAFFWRRGYEETSYANLTEAARRRETRALCVHLAARKRSSAKHWRAMASA